MSEKYKNRSNKDKNFSINRDLIQSSKKDFSNFSNGKEYLNADDNFSKNKSSVQSSNFSKIDEDDGKNFRKNNIDKPFDLAIKEEKKLKVRKQIQRRRQHEVVQEKKKEEANKKEQENIKKAEADSYYERQKEEIRKKEEEIRREERLRQEQYNSSYKPVSNIFRSTFSDIQNKAKELDKVEDSFGSSSRLVDLKEQKENFKKLNKDKFKTSKDFFYKSSLGQVSSRKLSNSKNSLQIKPDSIKRNRKRLYRKFHRENLKTKEGLDKSYQNNSEEKSSSDFFYFDGKSNFKDKTSAVDHSDVPPIRYSEQKNFSNSESLEEGSVEKLEDVLSSKYSASSSRKNKKYQENLKNKDYGQKKEESFSDSLKEDPTLESKKEGSVENLEGLLSSKYSASSSRKNKKYQENLKNKDYGQKKEESFSDSLKEDPTLESKKEGSVEKIGSALDSSLSKTATLIDRQNKKDNNIAVKGVSQIVEKSSYVVQGKRAVKEYIKDTKKINEFSKNRKKFRNDKIFKDGIKTSVLIAKEAIRKVDEWNFKDDNTAVQSLTRPVLRGAEVNHARKRLKRFYQKRRNQKLARKKIVDSLSPKEQAKEGVIARITKGVKTAIKAKKSSVAGIVALIALLLMIIVALGSCANMVLIGTAYLAETSYLASFVDVTEADRYYTKLEADLEYEIENIRTLYPGFDDYRISSGTFGHDPHALLAYLTVKFEDFKVDDIKGELESIFKEQYQYSLTKKTETRYRTVRNNRTGEVRKVAYQYKILEASLHVNDLETILKARLGGTEESTGEIVAVGNGQLGYPVPAGYNISSYFGPRNLNYAKASKNHKGIDFSGGGKRGIPIYSSEAGTVTKSAFQKARGWYIVVDHGGGISSLYQHLASKSSVSIGATVQRGQTIGEMGSSGYSTGIHLHYEVHVNGTPVNPLPFITGGSPKSSPAPKPQPAPTPKSESEKDDEKEEDGKLSDLERFDIYMESKGNFMFYESPIEGDWKPKISKMFGFGLDDNKQIEDRKELKLRTTSGEKVFAVTDGKIIEASDDSLTIEDEGKWKIIYKGVTPSISTGEIQVKEEIGQANGEMSIEILDENGHNLNPYFHLYSESKLVIHSGTSGYFDFLSGGWGQGGDMPAEGKELSQLFKATAYTSDPAENGGYSTTAMGTPLERGVVAVDPKVIPLGTKLWVEGYGVCRAEDTGGAIKGLRLDLLMDSKQEASQWGVRMVRVAILPDDFQPASADVSQIRLSVLSEAHKWLGTPYHMGSRDPRKGSIDCSGFTTWAYKSAGVNIEGTAQSQYNMSAKISSQEAKPGDLVFFKDTYKPGDGRWITHVGIYLGDGKMIHAGSPVNITNLDTKYWRSKFVSFGRVLP